MAIRMRYASIGAKIKVYGQDSISKNYIIYSGSEVAIDSNVSLTHNVVVNVYNGLPTGMYEICRSNQMDECQYVSEQRLISYDSVADPQYWASAPYHWNKRDDISGVDNPSEAILLFMVIQAIGGESITVQNEKNRGIEGENYKFDGTIDHGNSRVVVLFWHKRNLVRPLWCKFRQWCHRIYHPSFYCKNSSGKKPIT